MPFIRSRAVPLAAAFLVAGLIPAPARAASEAQLGEMSTYATILGRAAACNLDVRWPSRLVSDWLDDTFPPGSEEQQRLLGSFVEEMLANAALQRSDPGAASCAEVARTVQTFGWPAPAL